MRQGWRRALDRCRIRWQSAAAAERSPVSSPAPAAQKAAMTASSVVPAGKLRARQSLSRSSEWPLPSTSRSLPRSAASDAINTPKRSSGAWRATTASASASSGSFPSRAAMTTRSPASISVSRALRSSRTANSVGTPASSGKRRNSVWQKAWIVAILMPPGVSRTRAKSCRARAIVASLGHAPGQLLQGLGECPRPQGRPIGQLLVQPVCHLGGSSAGEGQAQDAGGIGPVEHQPQQAVDQHPRLAGSGRGGDPDGSPRAGGLALRGVGIAERPHSSASLSASRSRCR